MPSLKSLAKDLVINPCDDLTEQTLVFFKEKKFVFYFNSVPKLISNASKDTIYLKHKTYSNKLI